jgi:hypothetical protein
LLDADDDADHAALAQVGQQLVQVDDEEALVRHGIQVAIQAVDDDDTRAASTDCMTAVENSPGDSSAGSICCTEQAFIDGIRQMQPQVGAAVQQIVARFFEQEHGAAFAALGGGMHKLGGQRTCRCRMDR